MPDFHDQFIVQHKGDDSFILLGDWHGFDAALHNKSDNNLTFLQVGCRIFLNAAVARQHWCGGVTRDGGGPRPFAEALITLAEALCRKNGWANWAGLLLPETGHVQLHNVIAQRDRTIQNLRRDLAIERECVGSRNTIIEQRGKIIVERDGTIRRQGKIIAERDATIFALRDQADHPSEPVEATEQGPEFFERAPSRDDAARAMLAALRRTSTVSSLPVQMAQEVRAAIAQAEAAEQGPEFFERATLRLNTPVSRHLQREINELRTRVAELERHLPTTMKAG